MKRPFFKILFLLLMFISYQRVFGQMVGGEIFMQGNYMEIGIGTCGNFGTANLPPATGPIGPYHCNTGPAAGSPLSGLGFIADSGTDGWADFCGDYFVPGSPVEGWSVCLDGNCFINSDQFCTTGNIPGGVTGYTEPTGACEIQSGVWEGSINGLQITQNVQFGINDLFFNLYITLCNGTPDTMYNIYYARNVDPDNDAQQLGDYVTTNTILSQAYLGDPYTKVEAISGSGCGVSLYSTEPNSAGSYGGFSTEPANMYWPTTVGTIHQFAGTNTSDEAISIGFYWEKLAPGACYNFNYQYALQAGLIPSTFTYDVSCEGDTAKPTLDANFIAGGTFSFFEAVTDGAIIDPVSGNITNALGGSDYTVLYVTPPPCPPLEFIANVHVSHCCGCDAGNIISAPSYNVCIDSPATAFIGPIVVVSDNLTIPFQTQFILTDNDGMMMAVSNDGTFSGINPGDYCAYAINILTTDPDIPAGGYLTYLHIDTLKSKINTVDHVEKPGRICADLLTDCRPIKIRDKKTAGTDYLTLLCLDDTAVLHLYDLVLGEDSGGYWSIASISDPIPPIKFDALDATVNPVNVASGTYIFEYTQPNEVPCPEDISQVTIEMDHQPNFAYIDADIDGNVPLQLIINQVAVLNASGGGAGATYHWEPITEDMTNPENASTNVRPQTSTTYTVTVTKANGCIDTQTIRLQVIEPNIFVPNAFSPNKDGMNDIFIPIYKGILSISNFEIYNRWGERVYSSTNMEKGWSGFYNGEEQPMGTYVYKITGQTINNFTISRSGTVNLIR